MPVRRLLLWLALAIVGLLVAVGVTTAATTLTSQRVGLSAEPLDAGDQLAPKPARSADPTPTAKPKPKKRKKPQRTSTPQPTPDPTPTTAPVDDHGGGIEPGDDSGGHGSNSGHGGGDD